MFVARNSQSDQILLKYFEENETHLKARNCNSMLRGPVYTSLSDCGFCAHPLSTLHPAPQSRLSSSTLATPSKSLSSGRPVSIWSLSIHFSHSHAPTRPATVATSRVEPVSSPLASTVGSTIP